MGIEVPDEPQPVRGVVPHVPEHADAAIPLG